MEGLKLFQDKLLFWFRINGRHHFPWRKEGLSSYEIIIAEILLQRTKAETIDKFYEKFIQLFNSWIAIDNSDIKIIECVLKPLGLYRQRAKRLKDLASEMIRRNGILPSERNELEKLPFFGQYLANAILLQIFSIPTPLLDVNMSRVLERYFGKRKKADIRYDPYLQSLAYQVVNHIYSKHINWAILDFAAIVCKARKPHCETCILNDTCKFYNEFLITENVILKD